MFVHPGTVWVVQCLAGLLGSFEGCRQFQSDVMLSSLRGSRACGVCVQRNTSWLSCAVMCWVVLSVPCVCSVSLFDWMGLFGALVVRWFV
jgi:hypothetical protein